MDPLYNNYNEIRYNTLDILRIAYYYKNYNVIRYTSRFAFVNPIILQTNVRIKAINGTFKRI